MTPWDYGNRSHVAGCPIRGSLRPQRPSAMPVITRIVHCCSQNTSHISTDGIPTAIMSGLKDGYLHFITRETEAQEVQGLQDGHGYKVVRLGLKSRSPDPEFIRVSQFPTSSFISCCSLSFLLPLPTTNLGNSDDRNSVFFLLHFITPTTLFPSFLPPSTLAAQKQGKVVTE